MPGSLQIGFTWLEIGPAVRLRRATPPCDSAVRLRRRAALPPLQCGKAMPFRKAWDLPAATPPITFAATQSYQYPREGARPPASSYSSTLHLTSDNLPRVQPARLSLGSDVCSARAPSASLRSTAI
jgi:hypothetical protein